MQQINPKRSIIYGLGKELGESWCFFSDSNDIARIGQILSSSVLFTFYLRKEAICKVLKLSTNVISHLHQYKESLINTFELSASPQELKKSHAFLLDAWLHLKETIENDIEIRFGEEELNLFRLGGTAGTLNMTLRARIMDEIDETTSDSQDEIRLFTISRNKNWREGIAYQLKEILNVLLMVDFDGDILKKLELLIKEIENGTIKKSKAKKAQQFLENLLENDIQLHLGNEHLLDRIQLLNCKINRLYGSELFHALINLGHEVSNLYMQIAFGEEMPLQFASKSYERLTNRINNILEYLSIDLNSANLIKQWIEDFSNLGSHLSSEMDAYHLMVEIVKISVESLYGRTSSDIFKVCHDYYHALVPFYTVDDDQLPHFANNEEEYANSANFIYNHGSFELFGRFFETAREGLILLNIPDEILREFDKGIVVLMNGNVRPAEYSVLWKKFVNEIPQQIKREILQIPQSDRVIIEHNMSLPKSHLESVQIAEGALVLGFESLKEPLSEFFKDHPDIEKNVIIIMRFREAKQFEQIHRAICEGLKHHGLVGLRADDKEYTSDLWTNVCVHMLGCRYGIAVFEDFLEREFNPNVSLEYGFMAALNRRVLLLKEKSLPKVPTDITGKLWKPFDVFNIRESIIAQIDRWVKDLSIAEKH